MKEIKPEVGDEKGREKKMRDKNRTGVGSPQECYG